MEPTPKSALKGNEASWGSRTAKNVCLQINMAPLDLRYIVHILPHQLRMLGGQVEQIQFTVDSHNSRTGRYSTDNHADKLTGLLHYLNQVCNEFPNAEVVEVDYSPRSVRDVGRAFIGTELVPKKAYGGSPIYPYLYGLFRSRCDYVFHTDSDMLYGGGSQHWVSEAVTLLESMRHVLACNPLAGPPRADGRLATQTAAWSDPNALTYSFDKMTTRVFILDRRRLLSEEYKIPMVYSNALQRFQAFLNNTSPYVNLEDCITSLMREKSLRRLDFLGSGEGLWSLHPAYRSERFYTELPEIIRRIESNDIPDGQRGDYDLNDSMIDWSDVRRRTTLWHRSYRQLRFAAIGIPNRVRTAWYNLNRRIDS